MRHTTIQNTYSAGAIAGAGVVQSTGNFDHVTLDNCRSGGVGGAMTLAFGTEIYVTHTIIKNSYAGSAGGGMYLSVTLGPMVMRNVQFENCRSDGSGGAMHLLSSASPTIDGLIIRDCHAATGGGINFVPGLPTIMNPILLEGCSATETGGSVYVGPGSVINGGFIIRNSKADTAGGGMAVGGGTVNLLPGSSITNSEAKIGGLMEISGVPPGATISSLRLQAALLDHKQPL